MLNFIQIGTNKSYDHMSQLIHKYRPYDIEKIIMVEPFAYHNNSIQNCYIKYLDKLYIENIIITNDNNHPKNLDIFYHSLDQDHDNAYELASLNKNHSINIRSYYLEKDIKTLNCQCLTINELFKKHNMSHIDILYIDTEGFDDKIIYSINFDQIVIKEIFYENLHINKYLVHDYLQTKNYKIETSVAEDPYADRAYLCQ